MKLKLLFFALTIFIRINIISQWNLPLSVNKLDNCGNILFSKSNNGSMLLSYCPEYFNTNFIYGIQLCIDKSIEQAIEHYIPSNIDSSNLNNNGYSEKVEIIDYNGIINYYSYNSKKDTSIIINDDEYYNGGWVGNIFSSSLNVYNLKNEFEYNKLSFFDIKTCECNDYREYKFNEYFIKSDFFKKMLNSKSISFQIIDEHGNIKELNISMKNYREMINILNHHTFFDNNYWFWNNDKCLTKWRTTIHNKSGNVILKNQTVTFELLEYNQTIFKKSFPISQNIGIDEVIPIDLIFDTPLCLDNIEELKEHYSWKINLN
jgi:hypothetical protein